MENSTSTIEKLNNASKVLKSLETVEEAELRMKEILDSRKEEKKVEDKVEKVLDTDTNTLHLLDYSQVKKFKSIRRAIRRGHVTPIGTLIPKRPFNNTSPRNKRGKLTINGQIQQFYEQTRYSRN